MIGSYLVGDVNQFDLAVSPANPTVLDAGEAEINAQFQARLTAHNRQLAQVTGALGFWTDQYQLPFGGFTRTSGFEVDEVGRAKPVKGGAGYFVGLPLRQWQYDWQGSWHYFRQASVRQLARDTLLMLDADATYVMSRILDALFNPVNYDFQDTLTRSGVTFPIVPMHVKGLANADGLELPAGPNGERFDPATHTHYAATTDFTAASVAATIKTVREHTRDSRVEVWIPQDLEVGMRAMTTNFYPYPTVNVVSPDTSYRILSPNLDPNNLYDRAIGEFDGAVVWVKFQMPTGYLAAIEMNSPMKPVGIRFDPTLDGMNLAARIEDENHPMRARLFARHIGCGVWNRVGAAILKPNNADTVYVPPSFPALAA